MRSRTTRWARASVLIGALALAPLWQVGGVQAQTVGTVQSDILVLDPDRLFAGTEVGQRLTRQYQDERDRLIAHNRELEAQLKAEEQALTDARKGMDPSEFRDKADAFDTKVRAIRQENDRKARELERGRELAPRALMRIAEPILIQVMRDAGGEIILDSRQVLLRADAIDITDLAITRIDAAIGDGTGLRDSNGKPLLPEDGVPDAPQQPAAQGGDGTAAPDAAPEAAPAPAAPQE